MIDETCNDQHRIAAATAAVFLACGKVGQASCLPARACATLAILSHRLRRRGQARCLPYFARARRHDWWGERSQAVRATTTDDRVCPNHQRRLLPPPMLTAAKDSSLPAASLINPKALMSIRNLELRARVVVEGFWSGIHRALTMASPSSSRNIANTRPTMTRAISTGGYLPAATAISSRSSRMKQISAAICSSINSRSMTYRRSMGYTKAEYAATLAATLAYFLYLQGDAIGLLTFDERLHDFCRRGIGPVICVV